MAHVVDSEKAARVRRSDSVYKQIADVKETQWQNVGRYEKELQTAENSTNAEWALGQGMDSEVFLKRLQKLRPGFRMITYPLNNTKRGLFYQQPNGDLEFLMPVENGFTPEHSISEVRYEEERDFSVGDPFGGPKIERADVMKQAYLDENGEWQFHDRTQGLGWKRTPMRGKEIKRGWRTVLLRLIQNNWLRESEVEKEFGADNTNQWAGALGRTKLIVP